MAEPKKMKLETTLVLSFAALLIIFNLLPNNHWQDGALGFPVPMLTGSPPIKLTPFALPAIILQLNALAIIWFIGFHRRRSIAKKAPETKDDFAGCVTMIFIVSIPVVLGLEGILFWLNVIPSPIIPHSWDILFTWYLMSPALFFLSLYLCSYHSRKPEKFPAHLHATWLITIAFLVLSSWVGLAFPLGLPSGVIVFWGVLGIFTLATKQRKSRPDVSP